VKRKGSARRINRVNREGGGWIKERDCRDKERKKRQNQK
jgi:hypothetical protein